LIVSGGKQLSLDNLWLDEISVLIGKKNLGPTVLLLTIHTISMAFDNAVAFMKTANGNEDILALILSLLMSFQNKL
jgi:hypothetical protein